MASPLIGAPLTGLANGWRYAAGLEYVSIEHGPPLARLLRPVGIIALLAGATRFQWVAAPFSFGRFTLFA